MNRIREISNKEINASYFRAQPLSEERVYQIYNATDKWLQENDPLLKEKGKNYVRNARIRALHRGGGFLSEADEFSLSSKDLKKEVDDREEQRTKLKELLQELEDAAYSCLKPRDLIVFHLLRKGLNAPKIAGELHQTRQAINASIKRIIKQLRTHIEEKMAGLEGGAA